VEQARKFQYLIVWQKAHSFVQSIYGLTEKLPQKENYGLTRQFMRATIFNATNIA
jgi:four helix bundle protein